MPVLLIPAALAALAALALPILIHIARRSEQRPTDFAALRWLREKPRPRHQLRFDEWPLLIARLLLLTLVALWLARPVLNGRDSHEAVVAVVPGADIAAARALAPPDAKLRWLEPGFSSLDRAPKAGAAPVASLLRQLDAELPADAKLIVATPAIITGADGERPRLSRAIDWRIVPGAMAAAPAEPAAAAPRLAIRVDAAHAGGLRYLRAAATAWGTPAGDAVPPGAAMPAGDRVLVWLVGGELPSATVDWIRQGGTALLASDSNIGATDAPTVIWRDAAGAPLVTETRLGQGRWLRFARPLVPAAMPQLLDADFPDRLRALLTPPAPPPSRVYARDYAPLAGGRAYAQPARDLRPWLAVLIAAVLIVERWLATRRRRGIAP